MQTEFSDDFLAGVLRVNSSLIAEGGRQTKQFCFLDADCLVIGKKQDNSHH